MKNLYVVSIVAMRDNGGWSIDHDVVVPVTTSYERAKESGMKKALELWPEDAGWVNHGVHAVLVEDAANIPNRLLEPDDEEIGLIM